MIPGIALEVIVCGTLYAVQWMWYIVCGAVDGARCMRHLQSLKVFSRTHVLDAMCRFLFVLVRTHPLQKRAGKSATILGKGAFSSPAEKGGKGRCYLREGSFRHRHNNPNVIRERRRFGAKLSRDLT